MAKKKATKAAHSPAAPVTFVCPVTGATTESKSGKLPKGWKLGPNGETWSAGAYVVRALTIPIASVVPAPEDTRPNRELWSGFLKTMREAWSDSAACLNWATTALAKADGVRLPQMTAFSEIPFPEIRLYEGIGRKHQNLFPRLMTQSSNCLIRLAEQRYKAARWNVIWLRKDNFPRYKNPQPYPVHYDSWGLQFEEINGQQVPVISLTVSGVRWRLRLKTGPGFRRQVAVLRGMAAGVVKQGQLDLISKDRGQVSAKIVVTMLRQPRTKVEVGKTLHVATGAESFLVANAEWRGRPWIYNADHVRRWITQHAKRLQRWNEDRKPECRMPEKAAEQLAKLCNAACKHQNNRLATFCHTATKQVVDFAARNRVETIEFDSSDRSYLGESKFPWFEFTEKLKVKCYAAGICFVDVTKPASSEEEDETPPPLADNENAEET